MKKKLFIAVTMLLMAMLLSGCANACANCESEIEKGKEIQVDNSSYCDACIEYCAGCEAPCVMESGSVFAYNGKSYCKTCFEKEAYPIVLEDNEKVKIAITGHDDSEGVFSVTIDNKTSYDISVFQEGESALLDGKDRCIGETDGTWSFAYADVPANETITVFSSFRKSGEEWDTVFVMSKGHTFEFVMTVWIDDEDFNDFWDTNFKVTLTPEMFGYSK